MYIAPRSVPAPKSPKVEFTPQNNLSGGLDLVNREWKIDTNKTSRTKNMWFNNGELGKRWGQSYLGEAQNITIEAIVTPDTENIITNSDFSDGTTDWVRYRSTEILSVSSNILNSMGDGSDFFIGAKQITSIAADTAHKYYLCAQLKLDNALGFNGYVSTRLLGSTSGTAFTSTKTLDTSDWQLVSGSEYATALVGNLVFACYGTYSDAAYTLNEKISIKNPIMIDLTEIYGAGNEPTTSEIDTIIQKSGWLITPTTEIQYEVFKWEDTKVWDDTEVWDDTLTWVDSLETPTFSVYKYLYDGHIIKHCGTVLYRQNPTTGKLYIIKTGLTAKKGSFFTFNGTLYFRQTGNYISWDGTTASVVTPYIPTIIQNRTPTGGGDLLEGYNRIGAGFKNSFNGTGAATVYTLTDTGLDATLVTATVGGVAKVETVDFTVNRTTGVVTFTGAPASGTNNVIITAYKTNTEDVNSILDCLYSATFGGDNNNRVFAAGNGTGVYYWTGISSVGADVTYWDYNNYNVIGDNDEDITGLAKQYDTLCIFKEKEIYGTTYSFNGTVGVFKHFPVNSKWGCDAPDSIQNINNNLVWLNSGGGAYTLLGSAVESQRNVQQISRNINPLLLAETEANLQSASSVDANGKYWLCVGDKVYLWDYFISPYIDSGNPDEAASKLSWWYMDNINSYGFVSDGLDLYHVDRTNSKSVVFQNLLHDFEVGIPAYWRLPMRDYGQGAFYFDVIKAFIDVRGDTKTTINVTYYTSDDEGGIVDTEVFSVGSFSLNNFSLENFTLDVMSTKTTFTLIPNENNIELFGIEFANEIYGRDLNLSNVILEYKVKKEKR